MKTTVVTAANSEALRPWMRSIPEVFEHEGEVIYDKRNRIKVIRHEGVCYNVKRYRRPNLLNQWVYGHLRATKAERAFRYGEQLTALGIQTPQPVGYILQQEGGRLQYSYLITRQVDLSRNFYEFGHGPLAGREAIVEAMVDFAAEMHEKGVLHLDFSPGNILFDFCDEKVDFCIVDINRMRFGEVSVEEGCKSFARLWGKEDFFRLIAHRYAERRHADEAECQRMILEARARFWKGRHISYEYE